MLPLLAPPSVYEYLSTHDEAELHQARQRYLAKQKELRQFSPSPPSSRSAARLVGKKPTKTHTRLLSLSNPSRPTVVSRTKTTHHGFLHITRVPWESPRSRQCQNDHRAGQCHVVREKSFAASLFKRLPREVYDLILEKLEEIHHRTRHKGIGSGQPSPYLRDLYSLALTSRAWNRAATVRMYRAITLPISLFASSSRQPPLLTPPLTRLKLLRLTLRSCPHIDVLVVTLDLSALYPVYQAATIEKESIANAIASLIMACPNLERIRGFPLPYTHRFSRFEWALGTRRKLKERCWILADPDPLETEDDFEDEDMELGLGVQEQQQQQQQKRDLREFGADPTTKFYHPSNDPTERFLDLNSNHPHLSKLTIQQHCSPFSNSQPQPLTFRALIGTLHLLPTLNHLTIIELPACSFTNLTLMSLPPSLGLRTLHLRGLPGVNEKGVRRFCLEHPVAVGLERLELVDMGLGVGTKDFIEDVLRTRLANLHCSRLLQE